MADTTLSIGGVTLFGVEIPETLTPLGTEQTHAVHKFPGGIKTIRNLGAFPLPFHWSGIMSGPTAMDRKVVLERMTATGQLVTFIYERFALEGVLVKFEAHPRHQFYVPYTATFEPLRDLSGLTDNAQQGGGTSPESQLSVQQNALGAQQGGAATTMSSYNPSTNANAYAVATDSPSAVQIDAQDATAQ